MAGQAAELGAEALLVHPPTFARGRDDLEKVVVEYHDEISRAGLPLILFYLYEAAGGVSYPATLLSELVARPEVIGIKVRDTGQCDDVSGPGGDASGPFPGKVLLTGEDRFRV